MINKTPVIAITGTIASGKSLLGKLLKERGYPVIDTDEVVHYLFENSPELLNSLEQRFGTSVILNTDSGKRVDRKKLAAFVFKDEKARRDLESIVHPATIIECNRRANRLAGSKAIFMLVPLLFEANQQSNYDRIWAVQTQDAILRQRLKLRNNLTDEEIDLRLAAQLSQQEKARLSDCHIDNSGTIDQTAEQLDKLLAELE